MLRWRTLMMAGVFLMLVGALDPLEGAFVSLVGSGLAAVAAYLDHSRRWPLLAWAFALVSAGVAAMVVLSVLGGFGGRSGRSVWWGLLLLPYAAGWVTGLAGAALYAMDASASGRGPGEAARP